MKHKIVCAVLAVSMLSLHAPTQAQSPRPAPIAIRAVDVKLPGGGSQFPPGEGSALAGKCLICHSAGMVLKQPPLTRDQWTAVINKMRAVYGAPVEDSDVAALSAYFAKVGAGRQTK